MFWPVPDDRMTHDAQCHPYMAEVFLRLEAAAKERSESSVKDPQPTGTATSEYITQGDTAGFRLCVCVSSDAVYSLVGTEGQYLLGQMQRKPINCLF